LLILNFSVIILNAQHSRATTVRLDCILNWHVSKKISFEVSLSLKLLVYWRDFLLKMFENVKVKDVKEYSVKWTRWDSNRECLKFEKVGKPSSSTIITANNYEYIVSGERTASNSH